jgi:prevent-host-death family protein
LQIRPICLFRAEEVFLMRIVTATEAEQNLGQLLDAAQGEPVTIRRQNRDIAVVLSAREYDRCQPMRFAWR